MKLKRHDSNSQTQLTVESQILKALGSKLQVPLTRDRVKTKSSYLEFDGYWASDSLRTVVLVEVFAHLGKVKAAQRHKVQADLLKLGFAKAILEEEGLSVRLLYVFACEECMKTVTGRSWAKDVANHFDVEIEIIKLDATLQDELRATQIKQNLMS